MSAHLGQPVSVGRVRTEATRADSTRALTWTAHLAVLGFVLWLPVMHEFALILYEHVGVSPGAGQNLTSLDLPGCAANLAYMVVLALPFWIGASLAVAALRRGADGPAGAALMLNLVLGVMLVVFGVLVPF